MSASVNYDGKEKRKDWHCSVHNTDLLNQDENKFEPQGELSYEGKGAPKYSNPNVHEMGKMKRAQEQRIDEFSMQKCRENHETIQQLTYQLQQMQEQMNSMNDSGDFQMWNSN